VLYVYFYAIIKCRQVEFLQWDSSSWLSGILLADQGKKIFIETIGVCFCFFFNQNTSRREK